MDCLRDKRQHSREAWNEGRKQAAGKFAAHARDKPPWTRGNCVIYEGVLNILIKVDCEILIRPIDL